MIAHRHADCAFTGVTVVV
ncbi:hypothetical protein VCCP1040_2048, partial [Vibrio cholerae CP1040(13)]